MAPPVITDSQIEGAINEIILTYGNEPWLFNAFGTYDDGGKLIQIEVVGDLYTEDFLPRKFNGVFAVVVKVDDRVKVPKLNDMDGLLK